MQGLSLGTYFGKARGENHGRLHPLFSALPQGVTGSFEGNGNHGKVDFPGHGLDGGIAGQSRHILIPGIYRVDGTGILFLQQRGNGPAAQLAHVGGGADDRNRAGIEKKIHPGEVCVVIL